MVLAIMLGLGTPLAVAILTPCLRAYPILRDALGVLGGLVSFGAALHIACAVIGGATPEWLVLSIAGGLDLRFAITPLGAIFGLVASGLWVVAAVYSAGYMRAANESHQTRFAAFYALAIHAALGIAWSGNLLVLFIFYEILTFSTYPLVIHKQSPEAMRAGRLYLGLLVGTSLLLLLPAVVWVWLVAGTLDFTPGGILAGRIDPRTNPMAIGAVRFWYWQSGIDAFASLATGGDGGTNPGFGIAACGGGGQGRGFYHADGGGVYFRL